jgi:hypothetical protein
MSLAVAYRKQQVNEETCTVWVKEVAGEKVYYIARDIQPTKALISITEGSRLLEEDEISTKRREDRIRLANAAHKQLTDERGGAYPADQLQHDLLLFCRDLWKFEISQLQASVTAGDLTPTEPQFILYPYVIEGAGTIPFAPPGRGKSWTGLLWAVCVDAGINSLWDVRRPGRVLYINLERSEASFARRLGQVNEALGLPRDRPLLFIHARGKTLSDVFDLARATIAREQVVMVVIDSLSRAGTGSLVKDETANKAMDLANGFGCAWVFLAHTPRADEEHAFGSQMFDAAADITVQMLTGEVDAASGVAPRLGIGLKVAKANDIPKQPLEIWTYEFDAKFGIVGVRPAGPGEWPVIEDEGVTLSPQDKVVRWLQREGKRSADEIAAQFEKSRPTVVPWMDDLLRQGKVAAEMDGRRKVYFVPTWRSEV